MLRQCPVCTHPARPYDDYTAEQAAQTFVPYERDQHRHEQLLAVIRRLWVADSATRYRCTVCGFGYVWPLVAGSPEFYDLSTASDESYPRDRWEFDKTLSALAELSRPVRLLEIGAGDGAFLRKLRERHASADVTAVEYNSGSRNRLARLGVNVLDDLAQATGPFDAIVAFQTFEHVADFEGFLMSLARLLAVGGSIYLSVPYPPATDLKERLTGLPDMPPNHVTQWTRDAFAIAATKVGLSLADHALEPVNTWATLRQLAICRSVSERFLLSRLTKSVQRRTVRRLARLAPAVLALPLLLTHRREFQPASQWARLEAA